MIPVLGGSRSGGPPRAALGMALIALMLALPAIGVAQQIPLDPRVVPKFVEPLPMPLRIDATTTTPVSPIVLTMNEFQQKLLPAAFYTPLAAPYNAGTYLWCYKASGWPQTFPGPTLEARVGIPTSVQYVNNLVGPGGAPPFLQSIIKVDQTLNWADPLGTGSSMLPYVGPVPAVGHLHGGEVPSAFDGGPFSWFTPNGLHGMNYVTNLYTYPNAQQPATIWYHDHCMGATRLNVYAGLAGFYLLRDWAQEPTNLPGGPADTPRDQYGNLYEREIVIQDRMFDTNGQLFFPSVGINPQHPFWIPEFFGNIIMVNGKTWPFLQVEPRRYRFRFLDGSNARFYELRLRGANGGAGPSFWQIGSDGGLLDNPVMISSSQMGAGLRFAPGERLDVIVDFSLFAGQTLTLTNSAKAPFPGGAPPSAQDVGVIMQFRVGATVTGGADPSLNPTATTVLRPAPIERPVLAANGKVRALTLNEIMGPGGPLEILVNNSLYMNAVTETPQVGDTEMWEIINLTADTHPIHLHLMQFQMVNRQAFQTNKYMKVYGMPMAGMGPPLPYSPGSPATGNKLGGNPDVTPFLQGAPMLPDPNERGWKDTFRMNPGEVTRILVRVAPQNGAALATAHGTTLGPGVNEFVFQPWVPIGQTDAFGFPGGPGYVWHCHIIDHEDNEMMRPMTIAAPVLLARELPASAGPTSEPRLILASSNPSRGATSFRFALPSTGSVRLSVFDVTGRQIATLAEGSWPAGDYRIEWNDPARRELGSGIYLARLRAGAIDQSVRFLVIR